MEEHPMEKPMGMKYRVCDGPCGKQRRFDADHWASEGWTEVGVDSDKHSNRKLRICPTCSMKAKKAEAKRKAAFFVARKAREALETPSSEEERTYVTEDVRKEVIELTKRLFLDAGWNEEALRHHTARMNLRLVE